MVRHMRAKTSSDTGRAQPNAAEYVTMMAVGEVILQSKSAREQDTSYSYSRSGTPGIGVAETTKT
jgi:hypothetical protein